MTSLVSTIIFNTINICCKGKKKIKKKVFWVNRPWLDLFATNQPITHFDRLPTHQFRKNQRTSILQLWEEPEYLEEANLIHKF